MSWKYFKTRDIDKRNLLSLLKNEIPYLQVHNFIDPSLIQSLLRQFQKVGYDYYESVAPPIGKIGVTVFENQESSQAYFDESQRIKKILSLNADEHRKVVDLLYQELNAKLNLEPMLTRDGNYFAGLIRIMRGGALLHTDYAPFDAYQYDIGQQVLYQIACNIFLQLPKSGGGHPIVYNRSWNPLDEAEKITGSYGYEETLVENVEFAEIVPAAGDLVLFNSQNFHRVQPNHDLDEERITLSCFAGVTKRGKLILWS